MRQRARIELFLFVATAALALSAGSALAQGAPCGGTGAGKVPCSCGDIVITDTILSSSDPVLKGGCFPVGLFVAGEPLVPTGVTLDAHALNPPNPGLCDSSYDETVGLVILGDNVKIVRGIVRGCDVGILAFTSGSTIERVTATGLGDAGFVIIGDGNALRNNLCHDSAFEGVFVTGDGNLLAQNYCTRNGRDTESDGILVLGNDNQLNSNRGERNGGQGVRTVPCCGENQSDGRNYGKGNAVAPDCQIDSNPGGTYC